jgi:hypothetical protein
MDGNLAPYFIGRPVYNGHSYAGDIASGNLNTILLGGIGLHYSGNCYDGNSTSGAVWYIRALQRTTVRNPGRPGGHLSIGLTDQKQTQTQGTGGGPIIRHRQFFALPGALSLHELPAPERSDRPEKIGVISLALVEIIIEREHRTFTAILIGGTPPLQPFATQTPDDQGTMPRHGDNREGICPTS